VLTRLVHVVFDCADPARQARFWVLAAVALVLAAGR
jgi:hypothetical protein